LTSSFEPVHDSAPDIAGRGVANPIAQIWTGAMMLDHLGHPDAARAVVAAIERLVAEGTLLTRDLGGTASTVEVGKAVEALIYSRCRSRHEAAFVLRVQFIVDSTQNLKYQAFLWDRLGGGDSSALAVSLSAAVGSPPPHSGTIMPHRSQRSSAPVMSMLLTLLLLVIVALGQSGCATSLGYVPEAVKIRQMTKTAAEGATYNEVVTWADDVADGYDSRATMNRNALYGGALLAVAAASTLSALAIFSSGNPAIMGIPVGTLFASGTMGFYNSDQKADLYDRAGKYVRRLILQSRERRTYRLTVLNQVIDLADGDEAICLEWDVQEAIRKVSRHIVGLDPTRVVQALAAIPSVAAATPPAPAATAPPAPPASKTTLDKTPLDKINEALRSMRGDFTDLDVPDGERLPGHCSYPPPATRVVTPRAAP
jgi:hypothetical protein